MKIKIKGKEQELKFTYNSFRYIESFDVSELENIEKTPFKVIFTTEKLLYGALNHNPNEYFGLSDVSEYMEKVVETEDISELLSQLMQLLEESNFFKNLQGKAKK